MYPGSSLLSLPRLRSSRSCQRVARVTRVLICVSLLVGDCPSWFPNVSKAFQSYHSHSWFIDEASQNGGGPCVFVFVHFNPKELLKDVARVILHDVVRVVCEDHARAPIGSKLWNASWSTTWSYPLRSKEYDNQIQMSTSGPGYRDDMREDGVTWRSMRVIRVMRVQSWNTTSKSLSNNAAVLKRHVH